MMWQITAACSTKETDAVTALPHTFKRIRLNLARSAEYPEGSTRHGYEFVAPLDGNGHIDVAQWREHRKNCRVRRFWEGEADEINPDAIVAELLTSIAP